MFVCFVVVLVSNLGSVECVFGFPVVLFAFVYFVFFFLICFFCCWFCSSFVGGRFRVFSAVCCYLVSCTVLELDLEPDEFQRLYIEGFTRDLYDTFLHYACAVALNNKSKHPNIPQTK